jgi:DNA-binding response OmpR family regulator
VQSAVRSRGTGAVEERGSPDAVVLDVNMPDVDGLGLLVAIRAQTGQADLPRCFLSGRSGRTDVAAGRALGAVYLTSFVSSARCRRSSRSSQVTAVVPDTW